MNYGQRKVGRIITHFQFGLKDQPKQKQQPTDEEINREAKPEESKAAVIVRLTGTKMADFAKPGESWDEAIDRKKSLSKVKAKLK